jgi:phosphatidate cytidylyltransferase
MLKRVISAAVLIPAFVWVVMVGPDWVYALVVVLVSAAAAWELVRLFEHAGRLIYRRLTVVACAALTASFALTPASAPVAAPAAILTLTAVLLLSAPLWMRSGPATEPAALGVLALLYVGWLLGYAVLLHRLPAGPSLVLVAVGITWIGESAAYLAGSTFGRHHLAPIISPRKTFEGAAAQVVASIAASLVLARWLVPGCSLAFAAGVGAGLGVVGQLGDLAESALKRSANAKDTGGVIPGHGGMLDRLDSLLFNVPVFYYCTTLVGCGR